MTEAGFNIDIGRYKCTVFSDGTLGNEGEVFGLNNLFIDSGDYKILIDTGCGDGFQATAGHLVKNMEAAGIRCSDIDRIILTHGHIDHAAGCFNSRGMPVFPNARYITSEREWEYWTEGPGDNELQNGFFESARKNLLPIREKFDLANDGDEVLPGIRLIPARGHTPGNVIVDISSNGKQLLCIGDIIHSQQEFINPEYLSVFDVTPEQAIKTRSEILYDVVKPGTLVFACHFTFPGLGYIKQTEGVFNWQPV